MGTRSRRGDGSRQGGTAAEDHGVRRLVGRLYEAADYARFLLAILHASSQWDPFRLSTAAVGEMLTLSVMAAPGLAWGLAWGVAPAAGGNAIWHWGDGGGFRNLALFNPHNGSGIVILTNGHNGPAIYRQIAAETVGAPAVIFDWIDAHS